MSVLIKGMEMPKEGSWKTVRIYPDGTCAIANWQGDCTFIKGAQAVTVPDHGRLIDADALMDVIREHDYPLRAYFNSTDNGMFTIGIQQAVDEAPTIIPASFENLPKNARYSQDNPAEDGKT